MPQLVALDVAILPPPEVNDLAIALSGGLPPDESEGLKLDSTRMPHVTLTQQFVELEHVDEVCRSVGAVLEEQTLLPLRITGAERHGRTVWLAVEPTEELASLHARLMGVLEPLEQRNGGPGAFIGETVREADVAWVTNYRRNASFARFTPHVSLGHGTRPPEVEPFAFDARDVAACHLGRFCTCRVVLGRWTLTTREG